MTIDDILRGMRIRTPACALLQQPEDRHWLRERIERAEQRREATGVRRTWAELAAFAQGEDGPSPNGRRLLRQHVQALCRYLLTVPGARRRTGRFAHAEDLTDPAGARGLGCLVHLTARNGSGARFYWHYAAGIGDATAAYLLALESLLRGEHREAAHWASANLKAQVKGLV
ncbi:hypothetical protein [Streptomyces sp. UNOB3_S3]|uniref:hypothetical protein n=1 Tax=Streptomyces sp. UNOB3_S3 TaxID=2871682 RepID=UPI001E29E0F0|nr:hypothetical protein [Streptomyces sp. UNOB3_S3]MCC3776476.1 hypothetical protein [Streptomyces sp. UNOB3_S3]